jgi:two-component system OmpR family response regulator
VTKRVFLVEDMPQVQGVVTELLEAIGDFEVTAARRTEAEAKLWLIENPGAWDLAVVDLVLEQGTGMGVIPTARENGGTIVVFSDYATEGIRRHCIDLGADAVFAKSGQMQDFIGYCSGLAGNAEALQ